MNAVPPPPSTAPPSGLNVAPTVGGALGGLIGSIAAAKLGLNPLDPTTGGLLVGTIAGAFTALFHWLGLKTGIPGLG